MNPAHAALQTAANPIASRLEPVFRQAHLEINPGTPLPEIQAQFFPFAGLNHTARLRQGRLLIRISDVFADAPAAVLHALALILLAKLYRKKAGPTPQRTYRGFILRDDVQERARRVRALRGRGPRRTTARGAHADLEACFERLNRDYFQGKLDCPAISWSAAPSRRILGRYNAVHHTIVISRILDAADVPEYVRDFVMFHEMLHIKHPARTRESRLQIHTPEFRAEERRFLHYRRAKTWLENL